MLSHFLILIYVYTYFSWLANQICHGEKFNGHKTDTLCPIMNYYVQRESCQNESNLSTAQVHKYK